MPKNVDGAKQISVRTSTTKSASKTGEKSPSRKEPKSSSNKSMIIIIIIALAIAGGIWAFKGQEVQEVGQKADAEKSALKKQLEGQISDLQSEISGLVKENTTAKTEKQQYEEKIKALADAKSEFSAADLGMTWLYPAIYGKLELAASKGPQGRFTALFKDNNKLFLGGISKDYNASGTIDFLYTRGFEKRDDKYYLKTVSRYKDYQIIPKKIISISGSEALLVDENSFPAEKASTTPTSTPKFNPGQGNLGAIINLKSADFPGLAIWNQDAATLTPEKFEKLIKEIKLK
jgi:hypothetical protein